MGFFPTESIWLATNWVRWALSIGVAVGLLVGIAQSRSIYNSLEAERQSLRARHVEKQRDLVDHMNSILRHEVLNSTQTIVGNASSLLDAEEPIDPSDERLARIYRQGEDLSNVIQEVRSILHTMQDDAELERLDVSNVVRAEVEKIRERHPAVDVETRLPAKVFVRGDKLLGRVFGNLLSNAVEHNDSESVKIVVEGDVGSDGVGITVRDDGRGIPDHELDSLFERPQEGDHGLWLYLVQELVESYGGTIELANTGPDGTTFDVAFPIPDHVPTDASSRADIAC